MNAPVITVGPDALICARLEAVTSFLARGVLDRESHVLIPR
jgi:hypothetical protein